MKYLLILLTIVTGYSESYKLKLSKQTKSYEFFGSVKAKHQSKVSSLVEGKISKRHIEVGDLVSKNQILYSLDPYPQNYQLSSTIIEKSRLKNQLKFLKLKLSRRVKNEEAYTEEILEEVQLQVQDTLLQIESIETKIDLLKETLSKKEVRAPFNGIILDYYNDLGEFITIASPLLNIVSTSSNYVRVLVNRIQAKQIKDMQIVSLTTDNKIFEGKVLRIHPSEDRNHMRTIDIETSYADQLIVNQVLKVVVQLDKNLIKIPKDFVKNIHGFSTVKIKTKDSSYLKKVLGDFLFDDFVSENLALEGLILERF